MREMVWDAERMRKILIIYVAGLLALIITAMVKLY